MSWRQEDTNWKTKTKDQNTTETTNEKYEENKTSS